MKKIFEPFSIQDIQFKNRIILAPLTRGRAGDSRIPNDIMADYYSQRASAGLLITEATAISEQGYGWLGAPGIYTSEMVEGWKKVTDKVKKSGTPFFLQLWHMGRASHSDFHNGELPVAPSAIKIGGDHIRTHRGKKPFEVPRALTISEIKQTVQDYKKAAANAKAAGFTGVEIHGANGYLINQFLDPKSNQRTDEYGGSLENRFRFFKEVAQAVLEVWPAKCVGARLSPNGLFNDMGSADFRETFLYAAEQLGKLDLGYLHIMDGLAFGFHEKGEPMKLQEFRRVYKGAIIANCGYNLETAEAQIASGSADMIAFGRAFISNPDLPERFKNGWPLTPFEDMSKWYSPGSEGYSDYAPFDASAVTGKK